MNTNKNKIKKILVIILALTMAVPLIYHGVKSNIRILGQELFGSGRYVEQITTEGKKVMIPKMTIADACDSQGQNCLSNVTLISGKIDKATLFSIRELSSTSKEREPTTVCLNSIGGDNEVAIQIMNWIRGNGYDTCLASTYKIKDFGSNPSNVIENKTTTVKHKSCYSACPLVISSANNRILIGDSFKIGIHASGTDLVGMKFNYGGQEFKEAINIELIDLLQFSRTVPYQNMYILSDVELQTSKLFNDFRASRDDKGLALRLNGCASSYYVSHECPMDGITSPFLKSAGG